MTVSLVPIPPDAVPQTQHVWWPYVAAISERDKCDPMEKSRMLYAGEAQAFFIWDDEINKPLAFIGVQYVRRGDDLVGHLIWLVGEHRTKWVHLFEDLKTYLQNHQHCKAIKATARPGWAKHLLANGFRLTHNVMELEL